jgi:hypothetical protein
MSATTASSIFEGRPGRPSARIGDGVSRFAKVPQGAAAASSSSKTSGTGLIMAVLSCRSCVAMPALASPPFGSGCARKPATVRFKAASRRLAAGPADLAKAGQRAARSLKAPLARKPASLDPVRPGP